MSFSLAHDSQTHIYIDLSKNIHRHFNLIIGITHEMTINNMDELKMYGITDIINLTSGMAKNQERVVKAFYESEKAAKEVENMCFLVL